MVKQKRLIGIFGGTFDPVHIGHIALVNQLNEEFNFEKIHIIPCKHPVLQKECIASAHDRIEMLQIAFVNCGNCLIESCEINRETASYSVTSLNLMRGIYPNDALCFIIGMDAFAQLPQWYQWEQLLDLAHFIVVNRPGHEVELDETMQKLIKNHRLENNDILYTENAGGICFVDTETPILSSTEIRALIHEGGSVQEHVPAGVWEYIEANGLYL